MEKLLDFQISKHRMLTYTTRTLCSRTTNNEITQDAKWTPIYHFPMIQAARYLNRFKIYQTMFAVAVLPLSVVFYYKDACDLTSLMVVTGVTTCTCFTLYVATAFFRRLIGTIFIDNEFKNVTIAHLTFWGNRNDIVVPIDEIIPLTDGICHVKDAFVKISRYNTDEVLYLTFRFGKILDKEAFQKVFGDFEILGLKK